MGELPPLNFTGGAGGAAQGGTVGPTTYGAINLGGTPSGLWLAVAAVAVVWFFFFRKK